jgi:hypothetical protein
MGDLVVSTPPGLVSPGGFGDSSISHVGVQGDGGGDGGVIAAVVCGLRPARLECGKLAAGSERLGVGMSIVICDCTTRGLISGHLGTGCANTDG